MKSYSSDRDSRCQKDPIISGLSYRVPDFLTLPF